MSTRTDAVIAVVCGGSSAEAEVSRISGLGVAEALRQSFPNTHLLELDGNIAEALKDIRADAVFPALHGPPGEDGTFQGLLEILGYPYVGSGVRSSACAMDKVLAKHLFREAGLPVARDLIVCRPEGAENATERVLEHLGPKVVVKPSRQGSALGVSFPQDRAELEDALEAAWALDERVLVEERVAGQEITVGLLEEDEPRALPVVEVLTPAGSWYDFEHRYTPHYSEHIIPAELPEPRYRRVQEIARLAHALLGCRDLSRADFIVPPFGDPVLLEVNTLPGMTPTSLYPDAARAAGINFPELVARLAGLALARRRRGVESARDN